MTEKHLIDQIVINVGLYRKYQYKENEIAFYGHLESLRVLKGLDTLDSALDYCISIT